MSKKVIDEITWTPELVKQILPKVKVELSENNIVECTVGGRKLPFARVWLPVDFDPMLEKATGANGRSAWVSASWDTLASILNRDSALKL